MSLTGEYFSETHEPTLVDAKCAEIDAALRGVQVEVADPVVEAAVGNKYTDMLGDAATQAALRAATGAW